MYRFKKFFSYLITPAEFKCYCRTCILPINYPLLRICNTCKAVFTLAKPPSYFVHLSISNQIQSLFAKVWMTYNTDLNDHFEDVYDGSLYKQLMAPGEILSD